MIAWAAFILEPPDTTAQLIPTRLQVAEGQLRRFLRNMEATREINAPPITMKPRANHFLSRLQVHVATKGAGSSWISVSTVPAPLGSSGVMLSQSSTFPQRRRIRFHGD